MSIDKETTHESFAIMGFSRVQCSGNEILYGSDLEHSTYIKMDLKRSSKCRGLNHNSYRGTTNITTVHMSQNQFSEMITSMNMGEGIPVTLKFTEKDGYIEDPKIDSVVEQHRQEFSEHTKEVAQEAVDLLAALKDVLSGSGTVKKSDREQLIKRTEKVVREISANMPYMEKTFHEAMNKVVGDAKGTIEAFYQHRVIETGLNALENQGVSPKILEQD